MSGGGDLCQARRQPPTRGGTRQKIAAARTCCSPLCTMCLTSAWHMGQRGWRRVRHHWRRHSKLRNSGGVGLAGRQPPGTVGAGGRHTTAVDVRIAARMNASTLLTSTRARRGTLRRLQVALEGAGKSCTCAAALLARRWPPCCSKQCNGRCCSKQWQWPSGMRP